MNRARQAGLSLIELMIALTLGLVLIASVLQVFLSSRHTYSVQEGLSRLQESGRFALALVGADLREADYRGCSTTGPLTNTLKDADTVQYDFATGIRGYDDVDAATAAALGIPNAVAGTDVLVFRHREGTPFRVVQNNSGAQVFAEVLGIEPGACPGNNDRVNGVCPGDILMISDCAKSRVFQATGLSVSSAAGAQRLNLQHAATGAPGNDPSSWGGASSPASERFGEGAEIVKVATYLYYVAPGAGPDSPPALFRKAGAAAEELVDNVENMQVLFGVNSDDDLGRTADVYLAADEITDWARVVSAELALLVRSPDDRLTREPQTYRFAGTEHTAADGRLRQEFATTITLRNRVK